MKQPLLQLTDVSKTYSSGFTLRVDRMIIEPGERVGIVGNNGAGKTTLMLLCLGLLERNAGKIRISGVDIRSNNTWRRTTASYPGESSLISFLTPIEYWRFVGGAYGISSDVLESRLRKYEDFLEVPTGQRPKLIRELSAGNRKKIGLISAVVVRPALLVLDEPFANLDPRSQARLRSILEAMSTEYGCTQFISSHALPHIVDVCKRVTVLELGRIVKDVPVCSGSLRDLTNYLTNSKPDVAALP